MAAKEEASTARQDRERAFHNRAFRKSPRSAAAAFYSVERSNTEFYHQLLRDRCWDKRVLEYGCGLGSAGFLLAEHGAAEVVGIDISDVAIEQAAEEAERRAVADRVTFKVMDAEEVSFDDSSFDLVCGTGIVHHLDLDRALGELSRVLKPTGEAIFVEPLGHNPAINAFRDRTPGMRTPDEHPLLMSDLALAGDFFHEVRGRFYHLATLAAVPANSLPIFEPLVVALGKLDRAVFRWLPAARKHAWMVVLLFSNPRPRCITNATSAELAPEP